MSDSIKINCFATQFVLENMWSSLDWNVNVMGFGVFDLSGVCRGPSCSNLSQKYLFSRENQIWVSLLDTTVFKTTAIRDHLTY